VADRDALIAHLEHLAGGEAGYYERRRRLRVARVIAELRQAWEQQPRLLVETPASSAHRRISDLPAGVRIAPGEITVRFETVPEALERLLAVALAIGNDLEYFEQLVGSKPQNG